MDDDRRISVTICGDGGCGKSSLTLRMVRSQFIEEYDPTIEDSYSVTRTIDGKEYSINITDTAGQEEYRSMFSSSNRKSDAFLLVYDITNVRTIETLAEFATMVEMESEERMDRGALPPVKIVAGNKCDLGTRELSLRQVPASDGWNWARQHGCGFMETSARNMVNVEETFALIVRRVVESRRQHSAGLAQYRKRQSPQLQGHAAAVTNPLTPLNEKEDALSLHLKQGSKRSRSGAWKRFLAKLGCF